MNARVPDELISAYFDGEVSSEERTAIERLLTDNDEARHELDETARLSALLHSIPRGSAPSQLVSNVQKATDQIPLTPTISVAPTSRPRSLRREWTAAAAAALVTAASLLLVVQFVGQPDVRTETASAPTGRMADASHSMKAAESELPLREFADAASSPVRDETQRIADAEAGSHLARSGPPNAAGMGGQVPAAVASKAAVPFGAGASSNSIRPANVAEKDAAPTNVGDAKSDGVAADMAPRKQVANVLSQQQVDAGLLSLGLSNGEFLEGLKVGNVYEFVPQPADLTSNVAVVDLSVVDIERGAETIQVLLKRNSILPVTTGEKGQAAAKDVSRSATSSKSDELVVVYSVASGEQLAKTLEDVNQHPDLFLAWSSQPPLQLAMADEKLLREKSESEEAKRTNASDKSKLPDGARNEVDKDAAEAEQAVQALVMRNTLQYADGLNQYRQGRAMKAMIPGLAQNAPVADANPAGPVPAAGAARGTVGHDQDTSVNPSSRSKEKQIPQRAPSRDGGSDRSLQGYQQLIRLPMTEAVPLAEQLANQNGQSDDTSNGLRRRMALPASPQQADALRPGEANRAVKMLFVLHQTQPEPGDPASVLKARQ